MKRFKKFISICTAVIVLSLGVQSVFANEYQNDENAALNDLIEQMEDIHTYSGPETPNTSSLTNETNTLDYIDINSLSLDNDDTSTLEETEVELVKFEGDLDLEKETFIEFDGKQDLQKVSEGITTTKLNKSDMELKIDSSKNANTKKARSQISLLSANTSPATAKSIAINATEYGDITFNGDQRWFSTTVTGRTRLTPELTMPQASDYDLYLYWLNESTMTLHLISSSETYNTTEWFDIIVGQGTYYIRIIGFEGPGNYTLKMNGTNQYIQNELNDTIETATSLASNNFSIQDSINSRYDFDYFRTSLTESRIVTFSMTKPISGIDTLLIMNNQYYNIPWDQEIELQPGSYGFVVYSSNGQSSTSPYTLRMSSQAKMYKVWAVSSDGRYKFQQKISDGSYYVNNTPIDWNYSYTDSYSASYGHYNLGCYHYDMPTKIVMDVRFGSYTTTWSGSSSNSNVMRVYLTNTDFTVRRYASGTYGNFIGYTKSDAWLIINPVTGKVIDEMKFNYPYYYGGHKASFTAR